MILDVHISDHHGEASFQLHCCDFHAQICHKNRSNLFTSYHCL